MKKLQQERSVPQISLENLGLLSSLHGPVRFIIHSAPAAMNTNHSTLVAFQDGYVHVMLGFSSGFIGKGPKGLLEAIQTYLKRNDITIEHISSWFGKDFMILPGKGSGKSLHNFALAGIQGVGKHYIVEVW